RVATPSSGTPSSTGTTSGRGVRARLPPPPGRRGRIAAAGLLSDVTRVAPAALMLGVPARSDAQEPSPSPEPPPEAVAPLLSPDRVTFRILPFGSVDVTSRSEDGGHAGFSIGPFDLYMTSRLSEHWSAIGELVF